MIMIIIKVVDNSLGNVRNKFFFFEATLSSLYYSEKKEEWTHSGRKDRSKIIFIL